MNRTIPASKAKNNFGALIEEVYVRGNSVTITRNNKPVARVSPIYNSVNAKPTPALVLKDKEYETVKKNMEKFRKDFKFSF